MSASFWRMFGIGITSSIDNLLNKEDVTLEALLDEEDLLNECKFGNKQLLEFILRPDSLEKLFSFLTEEPGEDDDEKRRVRYPYLAAEVLCTDGWWFELSNTLYSENQELVESLWSFFCTSEPLNAIQTTYVARVAGAFFERKAFLTLELLRSKEGVLDHLIGHIGQPAVVELLLKMIACSESPEGVGVLDWLSEADFIAKLVRKLNPATSNGDEHECVAEALGEVIARAEALSLIAQLESAETFSQLFAYVLGGDSGSSSSSGGGEQEEKVAEVGDGAGAEAADDDQEASSSSSSSAAPAAAAAAAAAAAPSMESVQHVLSIAIKLLERNFDGPYDDVTDVASLPAPLTIVLQGLDGFVAQLARSDHASELDLAHGSRVRPIGPLKLKVVELLVALVRQRKRSLNLLMLESGAVSACVRLFFEQPWNNFVHAFVRDMALSLISCEDLELTTALLDSTALLDRFGDLVAELSEADEHPKRLRRGYYGHLQAVANALLDVSHAQPELVDRFAAHEGFLNYLHDVLHPLNRRQYRWQSVGGLPEKYFVFDDEGHQRIPEELVDRERLVFEDLTVVVPEHQDFLDEQSSDGDDIYAIAGEEYGDVAQQEHQGEPSDEEEDEEHSDEEEEEEDDEPSDDDEEEEASSDDDEEEDEVVEIINEEVVVDQLVVADDDDQEEEEEEVEEVDEQKEIVVEEDEEFEEEEEKEEAVEEKVQEIAAVDEKDD